MKVSKVDARRLGRDHRNKFRTFANSARESGNEELAKEYDEQFQRGLRLMEMSFDEPSDPFVVPQDLEDIIPEGDQK